jgi:hypothetical protein
MSLAIDSVLKPLIDAGGKYEGKVKVIIRLQVQPWHLSSTLTHESALAVGIPPSASYIQLPIVILLTGRARLS